MAGKGTKKTSEQMMHLQGSAQRLSRVLLSLAITAGIGLGLSQVAVRAADETDPAAKESPAVSANAEQNISPTPAQVTPSPVEPTAVPTVAPTAAPDPERPEPDVPTPGNTIKEAFILVGNDEIPKAKAGDKLRLLLPLVNVGTADAEQITVSPVLSDKKDQFPFEISRTEYLYRFPKPLKAARNEAEFKMLTQRADFGEFTLRKDLPGGYYKVSFKINYRAAGSVFKTLERYIFVKVSNPANPGSDVLPQPTPDPGNTVDPGHDYDPGNSSDPGGYVPGPGDGSGNPSIPRLICTAFKTNPDKIKGGTAFTLTATLKNTSKRTAVKNIRVTLASAGEEPVFMPESGASTTYIDSIGSEETYSLSLKLKSNPTIAQKIYPLNLKFEYEDDKGAAFSSDEIVSLMVYQDARCELGRIEVMPQEAMAGDEVNLTFDIINKGKSTLYNLSVLIPEGNGLGKGEFFIGNVEAGASKNADVMVNAMGMSESDQHPFQIRFEDAEGNVSTIDKTFTLMVGGAIDDGGFIPGPGFPGEEPEKPAGFVFPWWGYLIAAALLIVMILVIVKVVQRKKAKKEQEEIDALV